MTPKDLKLSFHSSYTPSPKVRDLLEVWDVKQWMRECIEDIHTHTRPHHYIFRLVEGQVEIKYKYWSTDRKWRPSQKGEAGEHGEEDENEEEEGEEEEDEEPIAILKSSYSVSTNVPLVAPDLESLHLYQLLIDLSRLPADYITEQKKKEWEEFVSNIKQSRVLGSQAKPLPQLKITRRQVTSPTLPSTSTGLRLPPSIQTLVDKENERPPVSIIQVQSNRIDNYSKRYTSERGPTDFGQKQASNLMYV